MPTGPTILADFALAVRTLISAVVQVLAIAANPWAPKDSDAALVTLGAAIQESLQTIFTLMTVVLKDPAKSVDTNIRAIVTSGIGPWAGEAGAFWNGLLADLFDYYDTQLIANKSIDPANASDVAAAALDTAATLGVGSRVVTAAFEAVLPKSLNVLNWLGPILANFSGFDSIVSLWREAQLRAAVGNLAEYNAGQTFRTRAPEHFDAEAMYARRLITDTQLHKLIGWSGLMAEFEDPMLALAYRPVQPFLIARAAEAGVISDTDLDHVFQFAGFRDQDIAVLKTAFAALALQPYQNQYLSAAVRSAELGTITPVELDSDMDVIHLTPDAKAIVQLTVATRKQEQLAELYRKSISEAYRYGQITDDQYVPALEAIGIGAADAQAHYAIDSIALRGRTALAAARAEARLEAQRTRAATSAATASYRAGTIDEAGLSAALIAAGVDPAIAAFIVTVQTERRLGPVTFVYGRELARNDALVLKEKVSAIEDQYKKQLIDDPTAAAALAALGLPDANAKALLAAWAALKTKPTTTGELLPR